jgi:ribonuclease HI
MIQLTIFTDGGSRGNPGPAGCGAVLYNASGELVTEISEFIGEATNNQAEYKALIFALKEAKGRGAKEIALRLDSELIVKQLLGIYRVKHPNMKPLFEEVKALLSECSSVDIRHVPREENAAADALANAAMDRGV